MCVYIYTQVFIVSHIPHNVLAIFHDFILLIDVGACRNQKPGLLKRENGKRPCRIGATIPGNCNLKSCLEDPEVADDNNEYDSYEDPKP